MTLSFGKKILAAAATTLGYGDFDIIKATSINDDKQPRGRQGKLSIFDAGHFISGYTVQRDDGHDGRFSPSNIVTRRPFDSSLCNIQHQQQLRILDTIYLKDLLVRFQQSPRPTLAADTDGFWAWHDAIVPNRSPFHQARADRAIQWNYSSTCGIWQRKRSL